MAGHSSWLRFELLSCNQMDMSIMQRQHFTNCIQSLVNSGFFVLFIYSGWFYVSNIRSKRTVNSVEHIEWKPYCVHVITRVPHRTHILSVWAVCLTNYVSSKFCTALYVYKHICLHPNMYTTLSVYHKTFVPSNLCCPKLRTQYCEAFFQLPNYRWGYLLTYSVEQSPSWEANWFCS